MVGRFLKPGSFEWVPLQTIHIPSCPPIAPNQLWFTDLLIDRPNSFWLVCGFSLRPVENAFLQLLAMASNLIASDGHETFWDSSQKHWFLRQTELHPTALTRRVDDLQDGQLWGQQQPPRAKCVPNPLNEKCPAPQTFGGSYVRPNIYGLLKQFLARAYGRSQVTSRKPT